MYRQVFTPAIGNLLIDIPESGMVTIEVIGENWRRVTTCL